ncbi:hypothetical protein AQJ91_23205 [Streptomyces dysideae]|uniref:Uncharacterized protein n=2 Tax=Streptomyces dysideae TaxID=909626 RepID=A0A117S082_9ACTN|nr:hypothetical protein AQJ91_23205 [Streptomyces dysideae]
MPAGPQAPDLEQLRAAVIRFSQLPGVDKAAAPETAAPALDLAIRDHRTALLRWLNSWGCRIRYPRAGETDLFDAGIRDWAARWAGAIVPAKVPLAQLTDEDITLLGEYYADLANLTVGTPGRPRSLGPTAAAKTLYRLRPRTFMPWDDAIANSLHGARDAAAFKAHQSLGRSWARRLLDESGLDERALASALDSEGRSLPKLLDDYCYMRFTRGDFAS